MPYYDYPPQYNEIQYYPPTLSDAESWEWSQLVSALTLPFPNMHASVCDNHVLILQWMCPDRDWPGERMHAPVLPITARSQLPILPDTASRLRWIRHQVWMLVSHELDEQLLFDGVRVFDPHRT
jgi:hypothetical protein